MKYYNKVCPIRRPLEGEMFAFCLGKECAFFCDYADSCAIPLLPNILADSDICRNIWDSTTEEEHG